MVTRSPLVLWILSIIVTQANAQNGVIGAQCMVNDGFGSGGYCVDPASSAAICFLTTAPSANCNAGLVCCYLSLANVPTGPPPIGGTNPTLPPGFTTTYNPLFPTTFNPFATTTYNPFVTLTPPVPGAPICGRLNQRSNSDFDSDLGEGPFVKANIVTNTTRDSLINVRKASNRMKRIVGGDVVPDNEYCYQVAIASNTNNIIATGVLISADYVLTSYSGIARVDPTGLSLKILLGGTSSVLPLLQAGNTGYSVLRVIKNPGFNPSYGPGFPINDAALIQINKGTGLDFTRVCTICLTALPVFQSDCRRILVSGYGSTTESSLVSDGILRRVTVNLIPKPVCENVYKGVFGRQFVFDPNSMCAGGELGRDTCNKDGGAPLTCINFNGDRYLLGLSSWGYGCGRAGFPGVYTNITGIMPWIRQFVPS